MTDERVLFVRYMFRNGVEMPDARRLDIQEPLDDSGDTDCWTYASQYAAEHPDVDYCEGICNLPPKENGKIRIAAHAWIVEDTLFGPSIVEFTPGYEKAFNYRGLPLDTESEEFVRAEFEGRRYSVIELMLAVQEALS